MLKPSQIERRVSALLEQHEVVRPSVPVRKLARELGATVKYEPFDGDISGALYRNGDELVIGVNALHVESRRRFSIAHEIGHLLLHAGQLHLDRGHLVGVVPDTGGTRPAFDFLRKDTASNKRKDPREIEANRFAAALLMPRRFLEKDLRSLSIPVTEDAIGKLARKYKVSNQAMNFRLMNLGVPLETC